MANNTPEQGIVDWEKNFFSLGGLLGKGAAKKQQKQGTGKLPAAWLQANKAALEQSMMKPVARKAVKRTKKRTAPLSNKRTPRKRSN